MLRDMVFLMMRIILLPMMESFVELQQMHLILLYLQKVISEIPKEKYKNIFKGAYERPEKYVPKNKTRKIKKNYK